MRVRQNKVPYSQINKPGGLLPTNLYRYITKIILWPINLNGFSVSPYNLLLNSIPKTDQAV